MTPLPVVPGNVLAERIDPLGATPPLRVGDQLGLQGREEALDHGIIPAIAPPTHADRSTVRGEQPLVDGSCVMRPAIGVVEHARWRCPPLQRAAQRWHGELLAWGRPRCPADHAARREIEHHREIQPPLGRRARRDVTCPAAVERGHLKATLQPIGGRRRPIRLRGAPIPSTPLPTQPVEPHQPRHPLPTARPVLGRDLAMDRGPPIPVRVIGVYRRDRPPHPRVRLSPGTRRPPPPRVVTRARDRQHPAHERNRKRPFLPLDASVPHGDGFAKYAVAFFRKSRSWRNSSFSRRKRRSSSASVALTAPSLAPVPYCFRHRPSTPSGTFNSSATSRNGRPAGAGYPPSHCECSGCRPSALKATAPPRSIRSAASRLMCQCGPTVTGAPNTEGSSTEWRPARWKPPPTNATSASAYRSARIPTRSTTITGAADVCSTCDSRTGRGRPSRRAACAMPAR